MTLYKNTLKKEQSRALEPGLTQCKCHECRKCEVRADLYAFSHGHPYQYVCDECRDSQRARKQGKD